MGNKKLKVWLPLIFSIVMIAGMYFGYKLSSQTGGKKGFLRSDRRGTLQEAMDIIRLNYVDPVPLDSIQYSAIQEMMSRLDPHSVYFPPVELKEANEELEGMFEGIGIEFNIFNDTVNVVYVIPNGPSEKAGLHVGDKIIKVDNSSLTGKLTIDEIKKLIKGPRGSTTTLQVLRGNQLQSFKVTRDNIPVSSIDAAYMIEPKTGYLRLTKFTGTSYEEFMQSMERLKEEGMQQLILDLRGNGGGIMEEAVDMADEFLDRDKLVVYTEGSHSKKREYRSKRPGLFEDGKLAILVDELSASASEVLAGAMQDWCRATVIGRRTFGKGLVQQQYTLSDGSAIRLTVARYFTPQGRSIQRSYEKGKESYLDEILDRYSNGEAVNADSIKVMNGKLYKTVCGDTVYGGGGIMPDIFVGADTTGVTASISSLLLDGSYNSFVYNYYLEKQKEMEQYKTVTDYVTRFNASTDMWHAFVNFASKNSVSLQNLSSQEKEALQRRLKASLARYKWRTLGFYQVLNYEDAVIKAALREVGSGH
jgi:carboxyl-terminal processing protease